MEGRTPDSELGDIRFLILGAGSVALLGLVGAAILGGPPVMVWAYGTIITFSLVSLSSPKTARKIRDAVGRWTSPDKPGPRRLRGSPDLDRTRADLAPPLGGADLTDGPGADFPRGPRPGAATGSAWDSRR